MTGETRELKVLLYELRGDKPGGLVLEDATRAGKAMHEVMTRLRVWETAEPADRAAVLWAMISGQDLATEPDPVRAAETRRHLVELLQHVIGLCDRTPHPSPRGIAVRDSRDIYGRLLKLPEGWRQEVVRRVVAGADMASTIADAQRTINRLRSHGFLPTEALAVTEPAGDGRVH